ncbi:NAD(P)/FAD-dependent oxidoreductase [Nocardia salmonicida]|uniref:flavin-containing monooxygenase n=1 Tax=Nocardia salmonicida TaxID=53431 RepID=UPI0033D2A61C
MTTVHLPVSRTPVRLDFDPEHYRARIVEERDKRLATSSNEQYKGLPSQLDPQSVDRYAEPLVRDSVVEEIDVAVLGGGFGGLSAGAYLTMNEVTNFRIIEQGGDFGGTWYWNRYPGVQCDVESAIYMPLLEETGYIPTKRYADGDEIFEHAQRIGRHFDLYRTALFQTTVSSVVWDDDAQVWEVRTDRGDVLRARFIVRANGVINKPQIPAVPGIDSFEGKIFHTSRWDYAYTGGNQHGNLDKLHDKRVAVVGTGASAIQAVPYLAQAAAHLYVIQRTPSTVGVRGNIPFDSEWAAGMEPGWQAARNRNFNDVIHGEGSGENLVGDSWTKLFPSRDGHALIDVAPSTLPVEDQIALGELADMAALHSIHRRIDDLVEDRNKAESLKPWYGFFCKRPGFNDEFYPSFNNPSVDVVSAPTGIDGITSRGLVVDGTHYDVDLIIFATGFETGTPTASRYGYDVVGRDAVTLTDYFADGTKTLHGFMSAGFPNFFEMNLSQNAYRINFGFMLDRKANHSARIIAHALRNQVATVEPTVEAQNAWGETVRAAAVAYMRYMAVCTPGYYNGKGDLSKSFFGDVYRVNETIFWDTIDRWWEAGTFEGLTLSPASEAARV